MFHFKKSIKTISDEQYKDDRNIEIVNFPLVTTIGSWAFSHCENLETVHFPYAETMGSNAFHCCKKLKTAYFPKAIILGMWAFECCVKLRTAYFPVAITVNDFAFQHCGKLRTAYFPKARSVETFAFFLCRKLKLADFPQATTIGQSAFADCEKLKTALFSQVKNIGWGAFESCKKLRIAYFPRAMIIKKEAFSGCDNLRYIVLPEVLSVDERKRIGLSDNVVMIAAKDFDKSLIESVEYELIEKLYSQGPYIAKALLRFITLELATHVDVKNDLLQIKNERQKQVLIDCITTTTGGPGSLSDAESRVSPSVRYAGILAVKASLLQAVGMSEEEFFALRSGCTQAHSFRHWHKVFLQRDKEQKNTEEVGEQTVLDAPRAAKVFDVVRNHLFLNSNNLNKTARKINSVDLDRKPGALV